MFLQMLKDEFPDVRLHIISKLELVNKGISSALTKQAPLLKIYSHWYRAPLAVTSPSYRTASRRQAMASPVGHH